jgi:hypothetical protein
MPVPAKAMRSGHKRREKMNILYAVRWDNGGHGSGLFPNRFYSAQDAQSFAEQWANERNQDDLGLTPEQAAEFDCDGVYSAEVIEIKAIDEDLAVLRREKWEQ